jgi:hypothetical protein
MRTAGMHITSTVEKTVSVYVDDCDEEDWYDGIAHLLRIMNRHLRIRREMAGEWAVVYREDQNGCIGVDTTDPANLLTNIEEALQALVGPNLREITFNMEPPSEGNELQLSVNWTWSDSNFQED